MDTLQGVVKKQGLTQEELQEIEQLAERCNAYEELDLKLNWESLRSRPTTETNDFLYYQDGQLVGFLPLFSFNSQEAEISGMVHPDYRRQRIYTRLFNVAEEEVRERNIPTLLLIVDHASRSGQAFVASLEAEYHHSEYKLVLEEAKIPATGVDEQVEFRQATEEDAQALAHITAVSFGMLEHEVSWYQNKVMADPKRRYYLGLLDNVYIGKIDVSFGEQGAFIYGFGVLPEYRGRGYGRQMLAKTIQAIQETGQQHISLEVATENKHALSLYQSCGFKETGSYDYYSLAL